MLHGTGFHATDHVVLLQKKPTIGCGDEGDLADGLYLGTGTVNANATQLSFPCLLTVESYYLVCLCPRLHGTCAAREHFPVQVRGHSRDGLKSYGTRSKLRSIRVQLFHQVLWLAKSTLAVSI